MTCNKTIFLYYCWLSEKNSQLECGVQTSDCVSILIYLNTFFHVKNKQKNLLDIILVIDQTRISEEILNKLNIIIIIIRIFLMEYLFLNI